MAYDTSPLLALHTMTGISDHRWGELLDNIASLPPWPPATAARWNPANRSPRLPSGA
jgi:hypothetical protein